ncbi:hypothetical protein FHS83_003822 [Rhizomicrobium palustre]|uniref:Tail specific protease domain-containing protein n=1 Tax=Rhizomicrobium palustre TaxID=189966 RepID=A0A846N395_9PROT|nr:S41 family peptidase [Rhizomicrobium palustre]NIK90504.1 hypothetical protein [Rhizomicrobium palustre]
MPLNRRRVLTGAAALSTLSALPAAAEPVQGLPDHVSPRAIAGDLQIIREAYGALHPGLTRYLAPGEFDRLIDREIAWANRERSPAEVYLMLARLTAAIRCGHTFPNPANQRRTMQRELLGRADRLPFCAIFLQGRMVITDPLESGLPRGSEILEIDGIAVAQLLSEMLPLTRADGHNDAKRLAQLELHRGDRFAAFDVLRPLLHPTKTPGKVELVVRTPDNRRKSASLVLAEEGKRGTAAAQDPQYGWRFALEDCTGLLTMPDWSLYDAKWDWRGFLNGVADQLIAAKALGLVIDLRENEGGIDCGNVLLARLTDRPISPPPGRRLVRFRETPPSLRPLLDTWDLSFNRLGVGAPPVADRPSYFDLGAREGGEVLPVGPRFAGNVAVLIGPICSSATFQFAELVKRSARATLVGAPTGGNRRGINGGCFFFLKLPETGFEVDLPLIGYFPDSDEPDAGLAPDVFIAPTREDVAAGRDPVRAVAKRICAGAGHIFRARIICYTHD